MEDITGIQALEVTQEAIRNTTHHGSATDVRINL